MRGTDNAASRICQVIRVSHWTILCDFDGTIALDDTTDTLLDRFGKPGWEKLVANPSSNMAKLQSDRLNIVPGSSLCE